MDARSPFAWQLAAEYDPQPLLGGVGPGLADDEIARTLRDPGSVPPGRPVPE
ncbi:hypothetical protein SAMN05660350_01312 [Geodermatophilus obscurus]|uniref:Uncharacterized protein n=1 Tax=Geodermatophilus obscurus TaxID=1861 RepID=A0A1M7T3D1_9ACTN|nr:hypothetical protein [Geodermatophilus obscurus]SHN65199.1 hypothetical protein SAMN05660350_01312 [Geodermatophilus obscurus]